MDARALTEALKFALHNQDQLTELTIRFANDQTVSGYLSKVSPGEVTLTEGGKVPLSGHDHRIDPERVASMQFGLIDGSYRNFP